MIRLDGPDRDYTERREVPERLNRESIDLVARMGKQSPASSTAWIIVVSLNRRPESRGDVNE